MSDLESEIRALEEKTQANRREFLRVELQTCFIAIDRARLELSLGNTGEAEKEFEIATRGSQVIEKFLQQDAVGMPAIEARSQELKKSLRSLRSEIDAGRG